MAYQPAPAPMQQQSAPVKQGNGFGVTALVLGIVAIAGFWIPILNIGSIIIGVIALIFAIIALAKAGSRGGKGKGTGGTGLVLAVLAIAGSIVWNIVIVDMLKDGADTIKEESIKECVETGEGLLTEADCEAEWDRLQGELTE
ncbi:hypothetical protein O1R50_03170 [Glycomyces luteolus]|uniref:DUF4190 domain-containing protein n=1 Tax=Glycomyces luteolus TaxID=2670330 RepID=A0A9X3P6U6_9ACTN|nr:hypothetical protein [Glycomyces luteolus]MDA1358606.1 hypothetical protein [Glycomyces luteolus]